MTLDPTGCTARAGWTGANTSVRPSRAIPVAGYHTRFANRGFSGSVMDTPASAESGARHLRDKDTVASDKLTEFKRRLWLVARQHLNTRLLAGVDPEDAVRSAVGTFFNHLDADQEPARVGTTVLNGWDDVEDLLVRLTINKCRKRWERAAAGTRDVTRTVSPADIDIVREPSADDGLEFLEEIQQFNSGCAEQERALFGLIRQGLTQAEAAKRLGVGQPLISLKIQRMIARLRGQLDGTPDP